MLQSPNCLTVISDMDVIISGNKVKEGEMSKNNTKTAIIQHYYFYYFQL